MARLVFQPIPTPPPQYSPQYHATVQRILQQTFSKVNYTPIENNVHLSVTSWMGL